MDVGVEFSHYKVLEHIGRGGMADVWSARDVRLARTVAIKTIARNLAQDIDPVRLFEREAQTIAALEHPHILPIYEFGDYTSQLYIVMRYVSGGSLDDVLEHGPLEIDEMLRVARAVGQALEYAHASKVIHLDLKPSNILLDSYQSPYLADFGLAAVLNPEGRAKNPGSGTLLYMAPEQLTDDELDHRADIYSFGIMLFHMLTGQLPFDASVPLAIRQLQTGDPLPELSLLRPGLPPVLDSILREATEPELDRRANSMRNLVRALEHVLGGGVFSADTLRMPSGAVSSETRGLVSLETNALASAPPIPEPRLPGEPRAETSAAPGEDAIESLLSGPIEGKATLPGELNAATIEQYISGPIDDLVQRASDTAPIENTLEPTTAPIADMVSRRKTGEGKLDSLMSGPIEQLLSRVGPLQPEAPSAPPLSAEALAQREAEGIYQRARRIYQQGQGRFTLGVTDFILIADYYRHADEHGLALDDSGRQMLLRGAFEYDHDLDYWWQQLDDEARRWTALHALRSQNAPARTRALELLTDAPDAEPPQIPAMVAQALQIETERPARLAAIRVLGARAPLPPHQPPWWEQAGLWRVSEWRPAAYTPEIDNTLAEQALATDDAPAAELAARVIGRLRSQAAIDTIASARRRRAPGAVRALAFARDEANSLPPSVGGGGRLLAWLGNSRRRMGDDPLRTVWRFVAVLLASVLAMGLYIYLALSSSIGAELLVAEIWGKTVSIGLTFGTFLGLTIVISDELPQHLRGFWTWWARALWAAIFGLALGTLTWAAFRFLFLNDPQVPWDAGLIGGAGIAVAVLVLNLTRLPGVLRVLLTAVSFYLPLWWAWDQNWYFGTVVPPIEFYSYEQAYTWLIPMIVLIAIGVNAQALLADARALWKRVRRAS